MVGAGREADDRVPMAEPPERHTVPTGDAASENEVVDRQRFVEAVENDGEFGLAVAVDIRGDDRVLAVLLGAYLSWLVVKILVLDEDEGVFLLAGSIVDRSIKSSLRVKSVM